LEGATPNDSSSNAPDIIRIRAALRRRLAEPKPFQADPDHASVALALAGIGDALQLCLIRRVEHPDDPWSGHMALPGGRASAGDSSAKAVAERETREEVGLELGDEQWIGELSELPVRLGGVETSMVLSPFVYHIGPEPLPLTPNIEVAEAYWAPLAELWDQNNASEMRLERNGGPMVFPAIRFREHLIWGLTHRVLTLFSDLIGLPLPHREQ
jgi:8-oxo-dGTP pyrophosphatase MutT (NUDIX family)